MGNLCGGKSTKSTTVPLAPATNVSNKAHFSKFLVETCGEEGTIRYNNV
tara:strand:+ start:70 stop:216 length:147 start_codon:yes stop_codon:yes gene_type:complete